jgi:hypothetical protein
MPCQIEMNATEEPRRISLGIQGQADPGELRDDKSIDLVAFAIGRQGTVRERVISAAPRRTNVSAAANRHPATSRPPRSIAGSSRSRRR